MVFCLLQAVLDGCKHRRQSAAGLRRGTVTGKDTIMFDGLTVRDKS